MTARLRHRLRATRDLIQRSIRHARNLPAHRLPAARNRLMPLLRATRKLIPRCLRHALNLPGHRLAAARDRLMPRLRATRDLIPRRFGSARGLVRLALARLALATGMLASFQLRRPQEVRRVVFVCLGNICRSAYAQQIAIGHGLPAASTGLSTTTGAPSPTPALEAAQRQGITLQNHRATDLSDFTILPGDLLLAMEVRHARALRQRLWARDDIQIALLGTWCSPPTPHLHDPHTLSPDYFDTCFHRIRQAIDHLHQTLRDAR
jgi:protein-tyrosine phosphatase